MTTAITTLAIQMTVHPLQTRVAVIAAAVEGIKKPFYAKGFFMI